MQVLVRQREHRRWLGRYDCVTVADRLGESRDVPRRGAPREIERSLADHRHAAGKLVARRVEADLVTANDTLERGGVAIVAARRIGGAGSSSRREMISSSFSSRARTASALSTTALPLLQALAGVVPLHVEERLPVPVARSSADDELGPRVRRAREQAAAVVGDLVGEDDPGALERDEIDRHPHRGDEIGT